MSLISRKKRIDEEETDPDSDGDYENPEELPEPKPKTQPPAKTITKEEIGGLIQYHQIRALELLDIYRKLE